MICTHDLGVDQDNYRQMNLDVLLDMCLNLDLNLCLSLGVNFSLNLGVIFCTHDLGGDQH